MNRPITRNEIESVIKTSQQTKSLGPYGFTGTFQHVFKEELIPILSTTIPKH